MGKKRIRWYYAKEYGGNFAPYHDFFGYFELYKFQSKRERDEWVAAKPYSGGYGRMIASGNDYATDIGEHKAKMLRYLMAFAVKSKNTNRKRKKSKRLTGKFHKIECIPTADGIWCFGVEEKAGKYRAIQLLYNPDKKIVDIMNLSGWKNSFGGAEDVVYEALKRVFG